MRGGRRKKTKPLMEDFNRAALDLQGGMFRVILLDLHGNLGWWLADAADDYNGTVREHVFNIDGFMESMTLEFPSKEKLEEFRDEIKWGKCPTGEDGYRRLVKWW